MKRIGSPAIDRQAALNEIQGFKGTTYVDDVVSTTSANRDGRSATNNNDIDGIVAAARIDDDAAAHGWPIEIELCAAYGYNQHTRGGDGQTIADNDPVAGITAGDGEHVVHR